MMLHFITSLIENSWSSCVALASPPRL